MSDFVYGHPVEGPIRAVLFSAGYDALEDDIQRAAWVQLPAGFGEGAFRGEDGQWAMRAPPEPPAKPAAPTSYYVPKVTFERRIPNVPWLKIQALRKTIGAYDETWLTDEAKVPLLPLVRGFGLYDATDQLNVLDAAVTELLWGFQEAAGVFGTEEEAAAAIAVITTPHPLTGEPGA